MMAVQSSAQSYNLKALLRGIVDVADTQSRDIMGLTLDSRQVKKGDVFVACEGGQNHGLQYMGSAVKNGAVAIICETASKQAESTLKNGVPLIEVPGLSAKLGMLAERFFNKPSEKLKIVGVTGTNGKTTCSQYIARGLQSKQATAVMGTLGNGPLNALEATEHTTPDIFTVHRLLNQYQLAGVKNVVMEVSSHGLDQGRVDKVKFNTAMFTNLTQDHLDYHQTMQQYAEAKRQLFEFSGLENAVINIDDEYGRSLAKRIQDQSQGQGQTQNPVKLVSYGFTDKHHNPQYSVRGKLVLQQKQGLQIEVQTSWGNAVINSPLIGKFNASNLLGVLAVLLCQNLSMTEAVEQIELFESVPGRMQRLGGTEHSPLVVVDYAHTPDALEKSLDAIIEHHNTQAGEAGKVWCVFGCGGDRDKDKRSQMGAVAANQADYVILTNDNPRTEVAEVIIDQIRKGIDDQRKVTVIVDRQAAIKHTIESAHVNDAILIAGKGHEAYQIMGHQKQAYPRDSEIVSDVLSQYLAKGKA